MDTQRISVSRCVIIFYFMKTTFSLVARTYPSSGTYSPAQRDLYTAVLNVQKSLIELCTERSGNSLMDLHRRSVDLLTQELKQIGFGPALTCGVVERELYPHYVGHLIGIGECWRVSVLASVFSPNGCLLPSFRSTRNKSS